MDTLNDAFDQLPKENPAMKLNATSLARPQLLSRPRLATRAPDFLALMKPRVMFLAVFTAYVGMTIAPVPLDPVLTLIAIVAIAAGAGAAGVLNMWYDADIDAVMTRTAMRPIPRGKISRGEALAFGLVLGGFAVVALAMATNVTAAALLACTILFYVVVYTAWLKRSTPQNIVIGGAAGALPPVIGWAAATGDIGLEPLVLFLIIFLWTPPHFWALSLNRADEYARAGVPMLPLVAGRSATTRQILIYSDRLGAGSELPWALGFAGPIYGVTALVCGAFFLVLAFLLHRSRRARSAGPPAPVRVLHLLPVPAVCSPVDHSARDLIARHAAACRIGSTANPLSDLRTAWRFTIAQTRSNMRYSLLAVASDRRQTLGGCTEGVLDPKGPIASAERQILFNALGIMLAIVIPMILATLGCRLLVSCIQLARALSAGFHLFRAS